MGEEWNSHNQSFSLRVIIQAKTHLCKTLVSKRNNIRRTATFPIQLPSEGGQNTVGRRWKLWHDDPNHGKPVSVVAWPERIPAPQGRMRIPAPQGWISALFPIPSVALQGGVKRLSIEMFAVLVAMYRHSRLSSTIGRVTLVHWHKSAITIN